MLWLPPGQPGAEHSHPEVPSGLPRLSVPVCLPAEAALDSGEQQLMKNMMGRVERLAQAAEEVRLALGVGRRVRHVGRHAWGGGRGAGGTQAGRQEAAHWCTASGAPAQRMTVPSASTLPLLAG
jgi:hypothetical protein